MQRQERKLQQRHIINLVIAEDQTKILKPETINYNRNAINNLINVDNKAMNKKLERLKNEHIHSMDT